METSPTIEAARRFLSVAWEGPAPTDAALAAVLDGLVNAYHETPDVGPSDSDMDAPRSGGAEFFHQVGARFPDYGYYPLADPIAEAHAALMTGDAIDDLGDIILDMHEVVWLADHLGPNDAHWSFRLHFFHWGTHARNLLLYLHGRQFG